MVDSADGLPHSCVNLFHCGDPVFPESQNHWRRISFSSFWSRLARLAGKLPVTGWTHRWWSALPAVPAVFVVLFRHVVGDPTHLLTVKLTICAAMFFINPPRKSSQCFQVEFWFSGCHASLLLVTVDSSWVHLSRSLAGLSTLPDQKCPGMPSGTARTCRGGYVHHVTHQADIVSPPCKIRFSGWWPMVFTMSNIHSAAVRSSAVPTCCRSELQHPVSPQEDRFLAVRGFARILGR